MFLLTICSWYVWSIYLYLGLINDLKVIDTEIKRYCLLLHRERFKLPQLTLENIGDTLLYMQFILIGTLPNITITFCFIFIITSSWIQGHKVQKKLRTWNFLYWYRFLPFFSWKAINDKIWKCNTWYLKSSTLYQLL